MRLAIITVILSSVIFSSCNRDSKSNDSFKNAYNRSKELLESDSLEAALVNSKIAAENAKKTDQLAKAYWMQGYFYELLGDNVNAQRFYLGGADAFLHDGNKEGAIKLFQNSGTLALHSGSYSVALKHYKKRLELAKEIDDKDQVMIGNYEVGLAYNYLLKLDSANHYENNVIDLTNDEGEYAAKAYIELGIIQFHVGNYDSARVFYQKSLSRHSDPSLEYKVSQNIANSYLEEGLLMRAKKAFKVALEKGSKLGTKRGIIKPTNGLGKTYAGLEMKDSAIYYLKSVYDYSKSYTNPTSRKKLIDEDLLRNPILDLGKNFELISALDPKLSKKMLEESVMENISQIFNTMETLKTENNRRSFELANAERAQSRTLRRLEEIKKQERTKTVYLVMTVLVALILVFLMIKQVFTKKRLENDVESFLISSNRRMKKLTD